MQHSIPSWLLLPDVLLLVKVSPCTRLCPAPQMHPSPVYRIIYCGVLSTPPSSITDNRRVDNSLVGCDAVLRCLWSSGEEARRGSQQQQRWCRRSCMKRCYCGWIRWTRGARWWQRQRRKATAGWRWRWRWMKAMTGCQRRCCGHGCMNCAEASCGWILVGWAVFGSRKSPIQIGIISIMNG